MSDSFTRNRMIWIERVVTDKELCANAKVLGVLLATKYLNRRTGVCWPAIATLADDMGVDEKTIRRATGSLVERGYLQSKQRGLGLSNVYSISFPDDTSRPDTNVQSGTGTSVQSDTSRVDTSARPERTPVPAQNGHQCPPNLLNEPFEGNPLNNISPEPASNSKRRTSRATHAEGFDEFWKQYPRKVAKGDASRAWVKALEKAPAQGIIAGAKRYAAEREGQGDKFTKHPATWLNAECWLDAPGADRPLGGIGQALHNLGEPIRGGSKPANHRPTLRDNIRAGLELFDQMQSEGTQALINSVKGINARSGDGARDITPAQESFPRSPPRPEREARRNPVIDADPTESPKVP